jgi:hypothetical protein
MGAYDKTHRDHPAMGRLSAGRCRATASSRQQDDDSFLGDDVGRPNMRAQYRGFRLMLRFILLAAIVALVFGLMEGAKDIATAFPSFSSVLDGAAWSRLLSGLGTLTTVAAVVVCAALLLRWQRIRARRKRRVT